MQEVQGERRPLELSPKVQVGGSNSSGAPVGTPAHSSSKETDAVMDSADVDIPLADRTHATAIESSSSSKSVKGTKRTRDIDEECEDRVAAKIPATTSVGLKRGRSGSSTISSGSSVGQEEDQTIDGEGHAVMHMHLPALSGEYKCCISAQGAPPGSLSICL